MQHFEQQAECLIKEAFPSISFEEMEHWTTLEFMRNLARAEWVLVNLRGISISQADDSQTPMAPVNENQYVKELIYQGLDPMLELYTPPEQRVQTEPEIAGIDWRGTI